MAATNGNNDGSLGEGFPFLEPLHDNENGRSHQLQEREPNTCSAECIARQAKMEEQIRIHDAQIARMQHTLRAIGLLEDDGENVAEVHDRVSLMMRDDTLKHVQTTVGVGKKRKCEEMIGITKKKEHRQDKKGVSKDLRFCKKCHSTHKGSCTSATVNCRRCGETGHKSADCESVDRVCYNCRQMGHISTQCPNPKVQTEVGGELPWKLRRRPANDKVIH